jgi:hypothetical protein
LIVFIAGVLAVELDGVGHAHGVLQLGGQRRALDPHLMLEAIEPAVRLSIG